MCDLMKTTSENVKYETNNDATGIDIMNFMAEAIFWFERDPDSFLLEKR